MGIAKLEEAVSLISSPVLQDSGGRVGNFQTFTYLGTGVSMREYWFINQSAKGKYVGHCTVRGKELG